VADHSAFSELLCALAKERARALVVGGLARKLHGIALEASDHTLWYDADDGNAAHVYRALSRVGAPLDGVEVPDLADVAYEFRYVEGECEVVLVASLDGTTFTDAWEERVETRWRDVPICVIGRRMLLACERATLP
jgi:hypothetical protein